MERDKNEQQQKQRYHKNQHLSIMGYYIKIKVEAPMYALNKDRGK